MLACGPAILSAFFLLQAETQLEAGARIETRVGEAPTGTKQVTVVQSPSLPPITAFEASEQFQVVVAATPLFSLRWRDDVDDLRADSATRILWRPEPLSNSRPLFLETLGVTHTRRSSKRSRLRINILGSYGEQDYASLQQQLPNQPALPLATRMLMLNATASAEWRSSRRDTLILQLGAMSSRSFNTSTLENGATEGSSASNYPRLPTQTTLTAAPRLTHMLARGSTGETVVSIIDTDSQGIILASGQSGSMNVLSIQPQVGLREVLTRQHQLYLAVGFAYTVALRRADTDPASYPVPLVQIDLSSVLERTRAAIVRSFLSAGTTAFVDPVLGAVVSRVIAQASVEVELGPWSLGTRCTFTTDISGRLPAVGNVFPDQTAVSADIPVRYRSSRNLIVEFGGRYTERAPHLGAPGFAWHNRELWLFLNLSTYLRPSSTKS